MGAKNSGALVGEILQLPSGVRGIVFQYFSQAELTIVRKFGNAAPNSSREIVQLAAKNGWADALQEIFSSIRKKGFLSDVIINTAMLEAIRGNFPDTFSVAIAWGANDFGQALIVASKMNRANIIPQIMALICQHYEGEECSEIIAEAILMASSAGSTDVIRALSP